jgi:hypothetical protein
VARLSSLPPREQRLSRGQPGSRNQGKTRFARTGKTTVDGEEAKEAAEDSQTLAEVGLTGEVGVVDVEAEVVDVAAEAEDDHLHP